MNTPRPAPAAFLALLLAAPVAAHADPRQPRLYDALALSPNGAHVATVEHDEPAIDGTEPTDRLVLRAADGSAEATVTLPCPPGPECRPGNIAFSPDGARLGFVLRQPNDPRSYVFEVAADGSGGAQQRLAFDGALGGLRYGPDGRLAMLAIPGAHKEAGAIKPGEAPAGEIGVAADEQRIAVLESDALRLVSPPELYVYEYDWRPGGAGFVGTAAPGNGDNQWWVARLWAFPEHDEPRVLYAPPPKQQLAAPVVSPDGRTVAFIGGIMSDFGSTGGDAYTLPLEAGPGARPGTPPAAHPTNLTPGMAASVTALDWRCPGGGLTATALHGADAQVLALGAPSARPRVLWSGPESLRGGGWSHALTCGARATAAIHETFAAPPEIEVGPVGGWHDLTHANTGLAVPVTARSLTWTSDGHAVQGWLLQPAARAGTPGAAPGPAPVAAPGAAPRQKMITLVHGGPGGASTPSFLTESRGRWLLDAGYDLFLPNPRGSFGGGEAFTLGNVRDFGHGDLRDILRGVDAALRAAPIDPQGLGLMGYSYGGYMTMWAVTQTTRFRAAVAGAGIANWQSYYGENGIDQWMIPFFGASVYDDPAAYARSSPMTYIKNVRTPTFEYVGDRDLECPMPQTQEFWHALHTLGVPTEFVVYPGQGHELHDAHDRADAKARTLAWFARWLGHAAAKP
jgi:dipeptidyl aminopeptidase/acylaminoacyl peptidase